jgi:hypothetical protein
MPNSSSFRGWLASAHTGVHERQTSHGPEPIPARIGVRHGLALRVATAATAPLHGRARAWLADAGYYVRKGLPPF